MVLMGTMKMENLSEDFTQIVRQIQTNLHLVAALIACLFIIHFINVIFLKRKLFRLGLLPRHFRGLPGIILSPFLHGNFNHVFFNSIPLFALMNLVLLDGKEIFFIASVSITLLSGTLVWCFGRTAIHIGASGLILGYWSYCLMGIADKGFATGIILGVVCLYHFGTLLMDLFPSDKGTSWEGHLFGFVAGIATYYLLPYAVALTA